MLGFAAIGELAFGELPGILNPIALGEAGTFTLTGNAVTFDRTAPAAGGTFTLTGNAARKQQTIRAVAGAFALSGNAANLEHGYRLVASPAVLDTQEQPMFQALGVLAIGQSGPEAPQATTFLLTGINAFFARNVDVFAEAGVFTLTGVDVGLVFQGYPSNIRIFPRVGRGIRSFATGRTAASTGPLAWDGSMMVWNSEQLVWNGQASAGGIVARTSAGRGIRARAFGG